ncbi:tyrosine-type recombinase/integrase [Aureimonas sp. D3]|uniref:tyrosine-type recombinase/integrase n=1 Tax=Aureimonas sp. D3 TaxID=1638164 RepID=UPI000782B198|nr:tyrosine-type recombinase/integrase [Aureimonas sp. D3]
MATKPKIKWLTLREGIWYYERRVPDRYKHLDPRSKVRLSCETSDFAEAVTARDRLNKIAEAHWRSLVHSAGTDSQERFRATVARARLEGFAYIPARELMETSREERFARLERAAANLEGKPQTKASSADHQQLFAAVMGTAEEPPILISNLVEEYEKATKDKLLGKSEKQVHKWRLPLTRAVGHLIAVIGDKPIAAVTRADAIRFRDRWFEWISTGKPEEGPDGETVMRVLKAETANKDITHIGKMIALLSDRLDLDLPRRFQGLRFVADEEDEEDGRAPFATSWIRDRILAPGLLERLNPATRGVILTMINTGARPSELTGLRPADIRLKAEIPHIRITSYTGRKLKTPFSKRELPLVGPSLEGAKLLLATAGEYKDNTDSLSALVGNFFRDHDLRERERQTLYSLRHSFKDRLTAADAPDIIDARLMGHKFNRPGYGDGPTLEKKFEWVKKIAIYRPSDEPS